MARSVGKGFDHTRLARIESGERPVKWADLYAMADAYEVPWEALVLAMSGQIPFARSESLWKTRDNQLQERNQPFNAVVSVREKEELTRYLEYLRFAQNTAGVLSAMTGKDHKQRR